MSPGVVFIEYTRESIAIMLACLSQNTVCLVGCVQYTLYNGEKFLSDILCESRFFISLLHVFLLHLQNPHYTLVFLGPNWKNPIWPTTDTDSPPTCSSAK